MVLVIDIWVDRWLQITIIYFLYVYISQLNYTDVNARHCHVYYKFYSMT